MQKLIIEKPTELRKVKEKEKVYNTVIELYKKWFENYYDEYNELSDVKKDKLDEKLKLINLKLMIMIIMDGLQTKKKN